MARKAKRPRRRPNTGTIRTKAGRAKPFEASFPLGHSKFRVCSFATYPEAAAYLDQLVADRDVTHRNIAGGSQSLKAFLEDWLAIRKPHLKPTTYKDYQFQCGLAVIYFGADRRIDTIARKDADLCYVYWHDRGYKNVAQIRMVLAMAFDYAEDEDYITRNPFRRAKAPRTTRPRRIVLTRAQRDGMLELAAMSEHPALWHLYSRMGLRRGEGIGLLWANVDWTNETITITQQYTRAGGGATYQETPKTPRASRTFPVPHDIIVLLRQVQREQIAQAAGDPEWKLTGLVFTNAHGEHLTVSAVRWQWSKLKRRAGITATVTIHDLRHTAMYHMEQAGIPVSVRMAFAGHATADTAGHYADHAVEDLAALRAALEKLA